MRQGKAKTIYLIGFMGCGKSAVSACLQSRYGMRRIETDAEVERRAGQSISAIFAAQGEAAFRKIETQVLAEAATDADSAAPQPDRGAAGAPLAAGEKPTADRGTVVSCGGGVPLREENVRLMREHGVVVFLTATPETIYERVRCDRNRPLLEGRKSVEGIRALLAERLPRYEAAADVRVAVDGKPIAQIAAEVLAAADRI